MKRTHLRLIGIASASALLATLVACDSGTPAAQKVTPKPPPAPDQQIQAPNPPPIKAGTQLNEAPKPGG